VGLRWRGEDSSGNGQKRIYKVQQILTSSGDTPKTPNGEIFILYLINHTIWSRDMVTQIEIIEHKSLYTVNTKLLWILRRLLRIFWVQRWVSNEEVLRRAHTNRELLDIVKQRKTAYLGHILRGSRYELLKLRKNAVGKNRGKKKPWAETTFMTPQHSKLVRRRKCWINLQKGWSGHSAPCFLSYGQLTAYMLIKTFGTRRRTLVRINNKMKGIESMKYRQLVK
jgi:hypothetical protein